MLIADRYEIGEEIGSGGMGTVFKGLDRHSQEPVAIKHLHRDALAEHPERIERFRREGEILRELNHPNIVKIIDMVEQDRQQYLIMEYISGGDLWALLARYAADDAHMPVAQVVEIGLDLADALTRTHRLNVVHRDLKPGNVLLAEDGTPRLTDFGVAYQPKQERMTEAGVLVGTVEYLPPEVLNNGTSDSASDIWAFGVMLFEMLAGYSPFVRDGFANTITAILQDPLPDLENLRPDCPVALVDLVYRMLERDPARRIRSVRQVGLELEALIRGDKLVDYGALPRSETDDDGLAAGSAGPVKNNLPAITTPFVGRESEIDALAKLLDDPGTRLITILGFGGMGKTRLAIEIANRYVDARDRFPQGLYFVALAPLSAPEFVLPALAEAVQFAFYGIDQPEAQLLQFLREKSLLLIMDNFEHVIAGAALVAKILEAAPGVKIIATSRERLNLHGETLFSIGGMDFPDWETPENLLEYSGIKLFLQSAQRVRPGFALSDADLPYLARICNLVQGMPLGIELAAAWVDSLSLSEIAAEVQRSLDFLESDMRDIPERHHSVRAVFDYSWAMLSDAERDLFAKLSVFRGGFTRYAAMRITGTTLRNLSTLVNKSLLARDPSGRFQIHELLRQYAAEALAQSGQQDALCAVHAAYYAEFSDETFRDLSSIADIVAVAGVEVELDNIRAAWNWAVAHQDVPKLSALVIALHGLYQLRGLYVEGMESTEAALAVCDSLELSGSVALLMVELLTTRGWLAIRLGLIDQARAAFERGIDLMRIHKPRIGHEDPYTGLGLAYSIEGDYPTAIAFANQGLAFNLSRDDEINAILSYYTLTSAAFGQGDYQQALQYSQQALALTDKTEQSWFKAYVHIDLGHIARVMGDYAEAKRHYQISYTIRKETFRDPEGMAVSLRHLGQVALLEGDAQQARALFEESLALYEDIGDRGGLASAATGLGMALSAQGDYDGAWTHLRRALQLTVDMRLPPLMLSTLVGVGDLLLRGGRPDEGRDLLHFVLGQPMSRPQTKDEVQAILAMSGESEAHSPTADDEVTLDMVVDRLLRRDTIL